MASEWVRCISCHGYGRVVGLGMVSKECIVCLGKGKWLMDDKEIEYLEKVHGVKHEETIEPDVMVVAEKIDGAVSVKRRGRPARVADAEVQMTHSEVV